MIWRFIGWNEMAMLPQLGKLTCIRTEHFLDGILKRSKRSSNCHERSLTRDGGGGEPEMIFLLSGGLLASNHVRTTDLLGLFRGAALRRHTLLVVDDPLGSS